MEIIRGIVDEQKGDFSAIGINDLDLHWKEMLMMKSTCASDELERPLWMTKFLPFPLIMRNLIYKLWYRVSHLSYG